MIESDAQLKVTQAQIQRLESALAVLRQTATPVEFAAQAPARHRAYPPHARRDRYLPGHA